MVGIYREELIGTTRLVKCVIKYHVTCLEMIYTGIIRLPYIFRKGLSIVNTSEFEATHSNEGLTISVRQLPVFTANDSSDRKFKFKPERVIVEKNSS